jgi:aldose 1-epimerase
MRSIDSVELQDGAMRVRLLSYGAVTQGWWYDGVPLILGYDDPQAYLTDPFYLGAIVGPVANRIAGAGYVQDGVDVSLVANEGGNTLHSGPEGLSARHWDISQVDDRTADLTYVARDGEAGFAGQAAFGVRVSLAGNALTYDMSARVGTPRPISLAQHNYYTLGERSGADLTLKMPMEQVLALSEAGIATGEIENTAQTVLDFRSKRPLRGVTDGIDRFFVREGSPQTLRPIAELAAPSGLTLRVTSDQVGAQVYTGHGLGSAFDAWDGVCIEPSGYPNAVNQPHFPSVMCTPASPYVQKLVLEVFA